MQVSTVRGYLTACAMNAEPTFWWRMLPRAAKLQWEPGDLPKLQLISRLQRLVLLNKMAA